MHPFFKVPLAAAVLALLGACTGPHPPLDWDTAAIRDQHLYRPNLHARHDRAAAIVTTGLTGFVVGLGNEAPPPAQHLVAEGGQLRLMSHQSFAARQAATRMGGQPVAPAAPAPSR
jgi:hypothetical protein